MPMRHNIKKHTNRTHSIGRLVKSSTTPSVNEKIQDYPNRSVMGSDNKRNRAYVEARMNEIISLLDKDND